jgi:hypothetical protein
MLALFASLVRLMAAAKKALEDRHSGHITNLSNLYWKLLISISNEKRVIEHNYGDRVYTIDI